MEVFSQSPFLYPLNASHVKLTRKRTRTGGCFLPLGHYATATVTPDSSLQVSKVTTANCKKEKKEISLCD